MVRSLDRLVLFAATAGSMLAASCASRGPTQHPASPAHAPVAAPHGDADADAMADRVRQAFLHAWHGYSEHAWGLDDLDPLRRKPHDWYGRPMLM